MHKKLILFAVQDIVVSCFHVKRADEGEDNIKHYKHVTPPVNSLVFMGIGYKLLTYQKKNKDGKLALVNYTLYELRIICIIQVCMNRPVVEWSGLYSIAVISIPDLGFELPGE